MSSPRPPRRRRNRHGRGPRGPLAWPPVPAMQTRAERFDDLVLDAASRLEERVGETFGEVEFAVEDVPPSDPAPWEPADIALGRLFAARGRMPARIVIYRRPVETRVEDPRELAALVNEVVVEQVAAMLGVDPAELDPGWDVGPDDGPL
ncbi:MAG: metallopeptidase family protein [Oryzihumus sp.]